MATNPELELAFKYVSETNRHLYLTGKAGTGKTTFLHRIRREVPKRMAVVAPTGVAAINAKGVTIHSLFQLPFGVLIPGTVTTKSRQFSNKKIDLIRSLDLLVIDEISMVRADILDGIDEVLRRIRRKDTPFGGLQLLMIGDLHQLPPVVKDSDWIQLRDHYSTAYFFGSKVLQSARPATIQLKHIYRQRDDVFIGLLNRVRNNEMDARVLATLNQRYLPDFNPGEKDGYITLTSHNNTARRINEEKLGQRPGKSYHFDAEISGTFPESMFPNASRLEFKVGAQVMFNKNDTLEKRYFNGKIGRITRISGDEITVVCPGDEEAVVVESVDWENRKIELNPETKAVEDHVIGRYTQHPLKLAWAITIHKSQGLTFEKVVIDAADAFAHGQVYVALSRCKTFEGIVLRTRIADSSVRTDAVVSDYGEKSRRQQPTKEELIKDKRRFQLDCLRELFNGQALRMTASRFNRSLLENERYLSGGATVAYTPVNGGLVRKVLNVGKSFIPHINRFGEERPLPEDNEALKTRLAQASEYFLRELAQVSIAVDDLTIISDNAKIQKSTRERHWELRRELYVADKLFKAISEGFDPLAFIRVRADAALDFQKGSKNSKPTGAKVPKDLDHPVLYQRLINWRKASADAHEVTPAKWLPTKSLLEIDKVLPTGKKSLLRVKSFGVTRYERMGEEVLRIINAYLEGKEMKTDNLEFANGAQAKEDTKFVTLQLYQQGEGVGQIAKGRGLKETTILGHLAHWVALGDISANAFFDESDLDRLTSYFHDNPEAGLNDAFDYFDKAFDYGQLRLARAHSDYLRVVS